MSHTILANKPLVEALVEIRWALDTPAPGIHLDPHYKILVGRFYDRVKSEYPIHEQLPTATLPDELVGYQVQHRFRAAADGWPLVQLGPGILSLNDTDTYVWSDFRRRALAAMDWLFEAHPVPEALVISGLMLRYIDARPFAYRQQDILAFLREKMRVAVALPPDLFSDTAISPLPQQFTMQVAYACSEPAGTITIGFATGQRDEIPALIWETLVGSTDREIPPMPQGFAGWIDAAHAITHDWFFKLIEGDLLQEFQR